MGDFIGSMGLIRQVVDQRTLWLLYQQGPHHQFIQTPRLDGESYREAIQREVAWQLELDAKRDFIVSSVPRLHYQSPMQTQPAADTSANLKTCDITPEQEIHWMIVQFFVIDLFGKSSRQKLAGNPNCHWWTTPDILRGSQADRAILHPLQRELIRVSEVISPVDG